MCMYICIYIYIYTCIDLYFSLSLSISIYLSLCIYIYIHTYILCYIMLYYKLYYIRDVRDASAGRGPASSPTSSRPPRFEKPASLRLFGASDPRFDPAAETLSLKSCNLKSSELAIH